MIKTILLAEDDEDDFLLFQEAIRDFKEPLILDRVKDGVELINKLGNAEAQAPDLIFLDINMPRRNGFECLSDIRNDQGLKHLPVVIFSTSKDTALVTWMYNSGANLYLCKPASFQELRAAIQTVLEMDWKTRTPYPPIDQFVFG
jgi:CheY-like chemotaxis protein